MGRARSLVQQHFAGHEQAGRSPEHCGEQVDVLQRVAAANNSNGSWRKNSFVTGSGWWWRHLHNTRSERVTHVHLE
jgi:hypothetical protein